MLSTMLLLAAAMAQGAAGSSAADTLPVVTLAEFTAQVRRSHPVARQAQLLERGASGDLLAARGEVWDPKLSVEWDRKRFGGTEYYDYLVAGLKVPTPIGVDLKLGYERTRGSYFTPDRRTPSSGLLVAGVSIPLARGVITDARRTAVAQAEALRDQAAAERAATLNKLVYGAVKDFAAWYDADRRRVIAEDGVALAGFRLDVIRRRLRQGDAAAIDTIEAVLEVERRRVTLLETQAQAVAAAQVVAAYLWAPDGAPVELDDGVRPSLGLVTESWLDTTEVATWRARAMQHHPDIQKALAKLDQSRAARRLAAQGLLPEVRLDLAALATRDSVGLLDGWPAVDRNYKLGLDGSTSLLLMKERGKLASTGAKQEAAELDAALARRLVQVGLRTSLNDVLVLERLLERQRAAVEAATRVRDGEVAKLEGGESTLFLVSTRDRVVLDERIKLATSESKYAVARAGLAAALGEPGVNLHAP